MNVPMPGTYSTYIPATLGKSVRNVSTNVTSQEFGRNLEASGFAKSISRDGKAVIYTLGNKTYAVYPRATSTGGPSAQLRVNGETVLKIRLK
jgi:hypothetical protein